MYERHGDTKSGRQSRLYSIWRGMLSRCYYTKHSNYALYGAKGIGVCESWRNSYSAFKEWAEGHGYRADKTIDRLDNAFGYAPENCRWATIKQQARNKKPASSHLLVEFGGKRRNLSEWSRLTSIGYTTLLKRYKKGERGAHLLRQTRKATDYLAALRSKLGNGNVKLSNEAIAQIRNSTELGSVLAKTFKVSESSISMIRSGKRRS